MKKWMRKALQFTGALALTGMCLPQGYAQPHAMDPLFVVGANRTGKDFTLWRVNSESGVAVVGVSPEVSNQHPVSVAVPLMRQVLGSLQWETSKGKRLALLRADEVEGLAPLVVQALSQAKSQQDVLVLSTARREGGLLSVPNSVSMRLFVQKDQMHLMVGEARSHALDAFRSVKSLPAFEFGARHTASAVKLFAEGGQAVRSDWLSFSLQSSSVADKRVDTPPRIVQPVGTAANPFDAHAARLKGLLMLKEQGLITEAEYQTKRQAILDAL